MKIPSSALKLNATDKVMYLFYGYPYKCFFIETQLYLKIYFIQTKTHFGRSLNPGSESLVYKLPVVTR